MDVVFRGVEFTLVGGGTRRLVEGEKFEDVVIAADTATQYGLFVDTCSFVTFEDSQSETPEYGDLIFESLLVDRLRCAFQNSRFLGVRSLQQRSTKVAFRHCYRNDFIAEGANGSPLRQFNDEAPLPGERTQSLRNAWQDTPWIQTGPRVNILRNADFADQDFSAGPLTDVSPTFANTWVLTAGVGDDPLAGFGKWAAFAGTSDVADLSPSPEAFYMALYPDNTLSQDFDESAHAVDLKVAGPKICTYQCLCRVKGTMRFALVDSSDPTIVFDELLVSSPDDFCDTTLVTLRGQILAVASGGGSKYMSLVIENPSGTVKCQWQVFWQQAWASERTGGTSGDYTAEKGLRNTAFIRTELNQARSNDFIWGVNSLSVKAVGRLQMPSLNPLRTEDRPVNVGWKNPYTTTGAYDLFDGEVYWDVIQKGVVCRMASGWFMLHQPERILGISSGSSTTWNPGDPKNLVYTGTANYAVTLNTDATLVVPGSVVRILFNPSSVTSNKVTVTYGGSSTLQMDANTAAEFIFADEGGTPRWIVTQSNTSSPH